MPNFLDLLTYNQTTWCLWLFGGMLALIVLLILWKMGERYRERRIKMLIDYAIGNYFSHIIQHAEVSWKSEIQPPSEWKNNIFSQNKSTGLKLPRKRKAR